MFSRETKVWIKAETQQVEGPRALASLRRRHVQKDGFSVNPLLKMFRGFYCDCCDLHGFLT